MAHHDALMSAKTLFARGLGTTFVAMGIVSDSIYALAAGSLGSWLRRRPGVMQVQRYFAGTIFIGLGVATALSGGKD